MLIGTRNWYTEFGVVPTASGPASGAEVGLANLAKPYTGALFSSGLSNVYGDIVLSVTWPRAVPVWAIGVVGMVVESDNPGWARFTLRNGGSGGTIVAQKVIPLYSGDGVNSEDRYRSSPMGRFSSTVTGDFMAVERVDFSPFRCSGLWASPALSVNADDIGIDIVNDSVVESGIDGGERSIDRSIRRGLSIGYTADSGIVSPFSPGDSIDSLAELLALAGNTSPVVAVRDYVVLGNTYYQSIHGLLRPGSGYSKGAGPLYRAKLTVEEL